LNQAVIATKEAYATTKKVVSEEYKRLKAAPQEFNCRHCQQLLTVTPSEEGVLPAEALCPKCNQATPVPKTVFENEVRASAASAKQFTVKAFNDVSGNPYITCDVCSATVSLPKPASPTVGEDGEQVPAPAPLLTSVTCGGCSKVFESQAFSNVAKTEAKTN
jgi:hypothetical protein